MTEAVDGGVHFVGLLEDITEWKQAQVQLVDSERLFRDLAENVPGVLYEWRKQDDGAFFFDYVSPKVQELFGVPPQEFNFMLVTSFLTNAGMSVTEALNGQAAVELARARAFDLILKDVQMPIKNGYETTRILRQELGLVVPIITLTANVITGERAKCLAAGMNDYLTKPFQEFSLLKMVRDWAVVAQRNSGVDQEFV